MEQPGGAVPAGATRLCGLCGYEMSGIAHEGGGKLVCPECGGSLSASEGPFVEPRRGGMGFWAGLAWPPLVLACAFAGAFVLTHEFNRAGVVGWLIQPAMVAGIVFGVVAGWMARRLQGSIRREVDRYVPSQRRRWWWTSWLVSGTVIAACLAGGVAIIRLYAHWRL